MSWQLSKLNSRYMGVHYAILFYVNFSHNKKHKNTEEILSNLDIKIFSYIKFCFLCVYTSNPWVTVKKHHRREPENRLYGAIQTWLGRNAC